MAEQTHYFLALPIPKSSREILIEWCEDLKREFPFKSWVHPEDYHITLAFLGNTHEHTLEKVKEEVRLITKGQASFELVMNGVGTFGRKDAPRIFWAGVHTNVELNALQKKVHNACTNIGFSLDERPYNPHITLARRWKEQLFFEKSKLTNFNQKLEETPFRCEEVVLFQTHLDRSPKYEAISRFRFTFME
jgi:RNA 2',3'-cyclic 3'-phosphodiesterase